MHNGTYLTQICNFILRKNDFFFFSLMCKYVIWVTFEINFCYNFLVYYVLKLLCVKELKVSNCSGCNLDIAIVFVKRN